MALDKRNRFLLQTDKKGLRHLYVWRPQLAQRIDMRPISFEQACIVEKELATEAENRRYAHYDYDPRVPADEDIPDNPVVEEVAAAPGPDEAVKDQAMKLARTNEDLLQEELTKLQKQTDTDQLEEYFLLKYRVELLPTEDLEGMKKEAASTLLALSNAGKLYEVKK